MGFNQEYYLDFIGGKGFMLNKKVILIAIFLITLLSISAVSANELADDAIKSDVNDSSLGLIQDSDSSTESSAGPAFELNDDKNVLKSSDDDSIELNNGLESSDDGLELDDRDIVSASEDNGLELDDRDIVSKSPDEHVLSMDEDAWFYDKLVFYEGNYDDGEYVSIDFVDNLENPQYISIKLSNKGSPIANVDLALLNDQDYSITKLTTGSDGIAIYNIPFYVDEFSVCVGFWHDENYIANYANVGESMIFAMNWDTWYSDPTKRYFDFIVTVTDMANDEEKIGAQVVLTSDSNQFVATVDDDGIATIPKVAYGTYEVRVLYDGYRLLLLCDDDSIEYYKNHSSSWGSVDGGEYEMDVDDFSGKVYLDLYYYDGEKVKDDSVYENNISYNSSNSSSSGGFVDNGTFTALQYLINRATNNSTLSLTRDYSYDDGFNIEGIRIAKNLTIQGNGHTLDALGKSRIFNVSSSNVTLNNIIFANGNSSYGGAIYNASAINSIFINNTASYGGAIYNGSASNCNFINNSALEDGGAIYNGEALRSSFVNNTAGSSGAAIYDCWGAANCSFVDNAVVSNNHPVENGSIVAFNPLTDYIPHPPAMTGSIGWGGAVIDFTVPPIYADYNETFSLLDGSNIQADAINNYGNVEVSGRELIFKSLYPKSENYTMALVVSGNAYYPSYVLGANDTYEAHFNLRNLPVGIHLVHALIDFGDEMGFRIGGGRIDRILYDRLADIVFPIYLGSSIEISSSDLSKYYGDSKKFTVNLTDSGNPIANANINVTAGGKTYTIKTNSNGQASLVLNLTPGSYDVVCSYNESSSSSRVTVRSTVNCQNASGTYLNAKVNATFLNSNGSPLANTKVSFKVGSKTYNATTNSNGLATASVDLGVGTYNVTVKNPNNNEQKTARLTISKAKSSIAISSTSSNNILTLTGTVSPSTASGNVVFNVNNKNYTAKISSGKATCNVTGLNTGNYTVRATYAGDKNLNSSTASTNLTFKKVTVTKIVYNDMQTGPVAKSDGRIGNYFCVKLVDDNNNAIAGVPIKIGFNGVIYNRTTNSEGGARLQINLANEDLYTFAISFLGDDDYQASFEVAKIDVNKKYPKPNKANSTTSATSVNATQHESRLKTYIVYSNLDTKSVLKAEGRAGEYFVVKLLDNNKKAMAGVPIKIGFNGVIYNRTTNATGQARLQINLLKPTLYTFAISYLGDTKYQAAFEVAKITVKPQTPKLTSASKTFKASAKTKSLSATLVSQRGVAISGQKVRFTVNGKTYTGTINSKGVATVKISLNKKGTYSCTVKFAGMNGVSAKSTKINVKIS